MTTHEEQVSAMKERCATITNNAFAGEFVEKTCKNVKFSNLIFKISGLAIAAGVKLGLFEGLSKHSSKDTPLTSQQFADHMDLRERCQIFHHNSSKEINF